LIERQLRDRAPAHLEFPAHGIGRDRARGTAEDRVHRSGNRPALGEIDLDALREERVGIWVVILDNLQTLGKGERLRITECFSGEVVKAERADEMHVAADPVEFGRNEIGHLAFRARANAAASSGRRSSASKPLPVSISTCSAIRANPSAAANRWTAAF